jgi:hypothetical protein
MSMDVGQRGVILTLRDFRRLIREPYIHSSIQEDEMKDHGISINKHCPCSQMECPIRGNCVLCVQNHLEHKRHIPECIQNILRPCVQSLADQMELRTTESRPTSQFWKELDKEEFLKKSIDRHTNEEGKSNH